MTIDSDEYINIQSASNLFLAGNTNVYFSGNNMVFNSTIRTEITAYDFYFDGSNYLQLASANSFGLTAEDYGEVRGGNLLLLASNTITVTGENLNLSASNTIDLTASNINLNGSLAINNVPYFPFFTANVIATPNNIVLTSNQKDRLYILTGSSTATFSNNLVLADAGFFVNLKNGGNSNITLVDVDGITTLYGSLPDMNSGMVTVYWDGTSLTAY
jgi:hypothetical protein